MSYSVLQCGGLEKRPEGMLMVPSDQERELGGESRTAEPAARPFRQALGLASGQEAGPLDSPAARLTDGALVAMLRDQPAAGVAALYDRYGRLVFSMALRIAQDHGAAEEIT